MYNTRTFQQPPVVISYSFSSMINNHQLLYPTMFSQQPSVVNLNTLFYQQRLVVDTHTLLYIVNNHRLLLMTMKKDAVSGTLIVMIYITTVCC